MKKENLEKLTKFDPDFSPNYPTNIEAARQRDIIYNHKKRAYVDSDGCLIRDKYGQLF